MEVFNSSKHPHCRYNPLRDEWVLVSPQRTQRPWMGAKEAVMTSKPSDEVPTSNPLSPGATRPNGVMNPNYTSTWWFTNDFPALLEDGPLPPDSEDELFKMADGRGRCEVLCFHPDPSLTLAKMNLTDIQAVVAAWIERYNELSKKFTWVQIFENRGSMMGASNPHPHGQIWSTMFLPTEAQTKDRTQKEYFERTGRRLLLDYLKKEIDKKERIVCESDHFVVLVPFWAVWPYETMLIPRKHTKEISNLSLDEQEDLAVIMKELLTKYDNLFECEFPYSMGWHGYDGDHWQLHATFLPPLLRSATVKKFQVGFELLAQAQRDISPETAAEYLRALDGHLHYTLRKS